MRIPFAAVALACVLTTFASQAQSAVYLATYKGTVSQGYDTTGEFGVNNRYLNGLDFVATYLYDTSVGLRLTAPGISDDLHNLYPFPSGNSAIDTTLTIDGLTQHISAATASLFLIQTFDLFHETYESDPAHPGTYYDMRLYVARDSANPSLDETFPTEMLAGGGNFAIHQYDVPNSQFVRYADGQLNPTSLSIEAVRASVPEPQAWAFMLLGFGLAGASLRHARRSKAFHRI